MRLCCCYLSVPNIPVVWIIALLSACLLARSIDCICTDNKRNARHDDSTPDRQVFFPFFFFLPTITLRKMAALFRRVRVCPAAVPKMRYTDYPIAQFWGKLVHERRWFSGSIRRNVWAAGLPWFAMVSGCFVAVVDVGVVWSPGEVMRTPRRREEACLM